MVSTTQEVDQLIEKIKAFSEQSIPLGALEKYIRDWSLLLFEWSEAFAWSYINYTRETGNEEYDKLLQYFIQSSEKVEPLFFEMKKNFYDLNPEKNLGPSYEHFLKHIKNEIELYREENIPLEIEDSNLSKEYQKIMSSLSIQHDGKEYTFQQAGKFLQETERETRKAVWEKIYAALKEQTGEINRIYTRQIQIRTEMAKNAGFKNFRDYMHRAKGRFDYTPQDCLDFHKAVDEKVVPLYNQVLEERKRKLGLSSLKPYDLKVDEKKRKPLHPFEEEKELIEKTIHILDTLSPQIGKVLAMMNAKNYLDLTSRKNKAPGGYNYPLLQSGITLLHESGHALHAHLTNDIQNFIYKNPPMEVAELASMSMELLTIHHWDAFYPEKEERERAQLDHLKDIISALPWIAAVDAFQHWIYLNPEHTQKERMEEWGKIMDRFGGKVDWEGYEDFRKIGWQRQSHILEVPFYYIEYGIAQLGALQVWRNHLENPEKGLNSYLHALSLGHRKSMKETYREADIEFAMKPDSIEKIMIFLMDQIELIQQ
jgi:oligoendopeptidase F